MIGCLLIHGFTGAPYEVTPLVSYLEERTNWLFRTPTLPGHGETLQLKGVSYQQWLKYAEKELTRLLEACDQVYVIGFSMGGLIASYLAVKYPVTKLVLLSAAAYYINLKQLAEDIKLMIRDGFKGNLTSNELFLRYRKKITATPISATMQFRKLVNEVRPMLMDVKVPTFIAQGESDGIVPVKSAQFLYESIGAREKEILYIPESKHHICHCEQKELLFERILTFLGTSVIHKLE